MKAAASEARAPGLGAADLTARRGDIDKIYREATKWADEGLTELI
jgi:hypothetical protein